MITQDKWEWFGAPGHHVCRTRMQFHLCTKVGAYLISTIGEKVSNHQKQGIGPIEYEDIGSDRLYESYVFKLVDDTRCSCGCGIPTGFEGNECDSYCDNDRVSSQEHHRELCLKYAQLQ